MCDFLDDKNDSFFLSCDLSTQQLKLSVISADLKQLYHARVDFDVELLEYRTKGGVIHDVNDNSVTAPVLMWVKALDLALDKLRISGCDFSQVTGISGCAQQHGSVYWKSGAEKVLKSLDPGKFLHTQLASSFSLYDSPVWMDSSTIEYCSKLEDIFGGPQKLSEATGSRANERFTGNQISKICKTKPDIYASTERISLVSSFLASIFLGAYAPIDVSDGSGMNLLDIRTKSWNEKAINAVSCDLESRLGKPVDTLTALGPISSFFVDRYGFDPNCQVVAFTGDNPSSLAGMNLGPGEVAISLGTSETVFLSLPEAKPGVLGHVLYNPVRPNSYMGLLCFKNGSLTRERIRNLYANKTWDRFSEILRTTPKGNYGYTGMYYDMTEIVPTIIGDYRFDPDGNYIAKFPQSEMEVRACVEGQVMRLRSYAERLGYPSGQTASRILVTGGASANEDILQVIADVFNSPVSTLDIPDSACLGAGYIAAYVLNKDEPKGTFYDYANTKTGNLNVTRARQPSSDAAQIYGPLIDKYIECERKALELFSQKS